MFVFPSIVILFLLQCAIRRGTAIEMDHAQLVHDMWLTAASLGMELHVVRVKSAQNIADLPSRGEFRLLSSIGVVRRPPRLDDAYRHEETWKELQRRWANN